MAWYWILLIIFFFYAGVGFVIYWFVEKIPQLEYDFKTLFGVLHSDEKAKVQVAVEEKMRLLTRNWEEEIRKADLGGKKSDGLKEAEKDYERAERLVHRFRIAGW